MEWGTDRPLAKHSGTKDAKGVKCIHLARPLTSPEPATRRGVQHRRCLFWQRANRTLEIYMQRDSGHTLFCQRWNWSSGRPHHSFEGTQAARSSRAGFVMEAQRITKKSPGFSLLLPQSGIPSYSFLTSSGSESLNSQPSPVQLMKDWQDLSVSNSRRNCHSWIGPLPGSTRHEKSLPTPSKPTATALQPQPLPRPLRDSSPRSLPSACLDRRTLRQGSAQTLDQVLWAQKKWRSSFQK